MKLNINNNLTLSVKCKALRFDVTQNDVNSAAFGFVFLTDVHIQAVHKQEGIELLKWAVLPFFGCLNHLVRNI